MPTDKAINAANARLRLVLTEVAARVARELAALVAQLDSAGGVTQNTRHNLNQVRAIRQQVREIAEQEALPAVLESLRGELPKIVQETLADYPQLGRFAPQITGDLVRLASGIEAEIAEVLTSQAPDALAKAMRASITGALSMQDLQSEVARALDTTLGRAAVAIDRGVRDFHEGALIRQSEIASELIDGDFLFLYVGPDDTRTRPYCDARLDKVLTRADVEALDPTERYNCRHRPVPVLSSEVAGMALLGGGTVPRNPLAAAAELEDA
ncbi:MAG: hypothetical protein ACPG6R_10930 [Aequoribacter sp.]|uniref:hypothetical protein n=1 Tax=Aequoribacter sp. TaxID=2847771 RepID=UPI003C6B0C8A